LQGTEVGIQTPCRGSQISHFMSLGEITLRSPSPARAAEGLVYIECQRLRSVAVVDIKPKVIGKMAYAVAAA